MGNKSSKRIPIDTSYLRLILKKRGISIRSLDKNDGFEYSSKSVERALKTGYGSYRLIEALSKVLNVPFNNFSTDFILDTTKVIGEFVGNLLELPYVESILVKNDFKKDEYEVRIIVDDGNYIISRRYSKKEISYRYYDFFNLEVENFERSYKRRAIKNGQNE